MKRKLIKGFLISISLLFLAACSSESSIKAPLLSHSFIWLNRPIDYPLPNFMNKLVLLEFMTDQCQACIVQLPALKKLKEKFVNKIDCIVIFTPSRHLTSFEANVVIEQLNIDSPVMFDEEAKIAAEYDIIGWPTLILISRGKIKKIWFGIQTFEQLNQYIQQL